MVPDLNIQTSAQWDSKLSTKLSPLCNTHFAPDKLDYICNLDISCALYTLEDGGLKGSELPMTPNAGSNAFSKIYRNLWGSGNKEENSIIRITSIIKNFQLP